MGVGSPFAIAMKMGWFKPEGLDVEIVPLPDSTDCVKSVATGQLLITLPSVEPLAIVRPQGIKAKIFYTAYQTNGYGLAVPADSPIQKAADLKGKNIGVTSLASAGVVVARAQVAAAGLDPDRDVNIVVAGEGAQPAALIRNRQIDALSQFDTQYALIANAGVAMRYLDRSQIERFPGNGFLTLEESLKTRRKELVGLGRAYAKGTIFTLNNPSWPPRTSRRSGCRISRPRCSACPTRDGRGRRISGARSGRTRSPVSKTPWPGSRSRAISS